MSEGEWQSGGEAPRAAKAEEVRLARESIEELTKPLAELLAAALDSDPPGPPRQLSAEEVARRWGIRRRWVYEHADELGARRLGRGPRPRLRFDPEEVAERLGMPPGGRPVARDMRGLRRYGGDGGIDSLRARSRATGMKLRSGGPSGPGRSFGRSGQGPPWSR